MLTITIPASESFDEVKNEFVTFEEVVLELEHSLVSLSKWESIHEKPFLSNDEKTSEETLDYIKAMTKTPNIPSDVFSRLSSEHVEVINKYIHAKMSATWFSERKGSNAPPSRKVITSELIYYWMIALNIPLTCEDWHLSRLFTLIKVCNEQNAPAKKTPRGELAAQRRNLNAERKAKLKTNG